MTAPSPAGLFPLLDQLDEARAKGTPGPWRAVESGDSGNRYHAVRAGVDTTVVMTWTGAIAAQIVAEHNAVPQLTAAIRAVAELAVQLDWRAVEFDEIADDLDDCAVNRAAARTAQEAADSIRAALTAALTPGADTAGATA